MLTNYFSSILMTIIVFLIGIFTNKINFPNNVILQKIVVKHYK